MPVGMMVILFLVVILTVSVINYNPEMKSTPVRNVVLV